MVREPDRPSLAAWLTAQGFRSTLAASRPGRRAMPCPRRSHAQATAAPTGGPARASCSPTSASSPPPQTSGFRHRMRASPQSRNLQVWVDARHRAPAWSRMDTETDGLDAMRARLVGLSLATAPGHACYVPLRHEVLAEQISLPARRSPRLAPLLSDPVGAENLAERQVRHDGAGAAPASRWSRRSTTPC